MAVEHNLLCKSCSSLNWFIVNRYIAIHVVDQQMNTSKLCFNIHVYY